MKCKCCGEDEKILQEDGITLNNDGLCTYCEKRKNAIKYTDRKAGNVSLADFSIYADPNDFLEVTEWTNKEGIDINMYERGQEHQWSILYDDLEALLNIVSGFGTFEPFNFFKK